MLDLGPDAEHLARALAARRLRRGRKSAVLGFGAVFRAAAERSSCPTFTASPPGRATTISGRGLRPASCSLPASRATRRASWCCIPMTATPPTWRWKISPPRTHCWPIAGQGSAARAEHGGPVRLVVPHLYFWKSAKWLQRIEFVTEDAPGYLGSPRLPQPRRSAGPNKRYSERLEFKQWTGEDPCRLNAFNSPAKAAINWPPRWILPDGRAAAYALFAHCFTCGKDVLAAKRIVGRAGRQGHCGAALDFTGLGLQRRRFRQFDVLLQRRRPRPRRRSSARKPRGALDPDRPQPRRCGDPGRGRQDPGRQGGRDHRGAVRSRACHRICSRSGSTSAAQGEVEVSTRRTAVSDQARIPRRHRRAQTW